MKEASRWPTNKDNAGRQGSRVDAADNPAHACVLRADMTRDPPTVTGHRAKQPCAASLPATGSADYWYQGLPVPRTAMKKKFPGPSPAMRQIG